MRSSRIAADAFAFMPAARPQGTARAHADGEEFCSIIAGYHWFGDGGRDAMIALEGLLLATGRHAEARHVLTSFPRYERDGLLPTMFPEGASEGRYTSADASLWFFHALERYFEHTGDGLTVQRLLPVLRTIVAHHRDGTRRGIHVDLRDGLLVRGDPPRRSRGWTHDSTRRS